MFKLMQHQIESIEMAKKKPDMYLAHEPGTGKTCTTIHMIKDRCEEAGRMKRVLILCPQIVMRHWKREFAKYSTLDQKHIHVLQGAVSKRIDEVKLLTGYSAILITNYDALQNDAYTMALKKFDPEILVCDEAHVLKNYKSKRAKNAAYIADGCTNKYLLSGTPILNNAMDLFMQYRVATGNRGKDAIFPFNFFVFRSMYFEDSNSSWSSKPGYFPKFTPKASSYKELTDRIGRITTRVLKTECLDLPPLVIQEVEVEMNKDQEKIYIEMERDFITTIQSEEEKGTNKAVIAQLAVTKALRLQQIVSGFAKTEDGEVIRVKNCPRIEALKELLEQLVPSHKVIVWANFKENYKMIAEVCKEIGVEYVEVHGEVGARDKFKAVDAFNTRPEVRVFIGNQGAGGIGIDLIPATYAIYYSRGFKLGDDLQSESRNYRRGSEVHSKITRINLVTPKSIDKVVATALASKIDISNEILSFKKQIQEARKELI